MQNSCILKPYLSVCDCLMNQRMGCMGWKLNTQNKELILRKSFGAFFIVKMAYYPHLNKKDLFSCEHSTQSKSSMYACIMLGTEFGTFTVFYSKYVLMSLPDLWQGLHRAQLTQTQTYETSFWSPVAFPLVCSPTASPFLFREWAHIYIFISIG